MACLSHLIPARLHWSEKKIYSDPDFLNEHYLYRLGNPIEFQNTITAYSCLWSFLISEADILHSQDPVKFSDYRYAKIDELRNFSLKRDKTIDNSHLGLHVLSCFFIHSPNDCVYAHSEINIKHEIFSPENSEERISFFELDYNNWKKSLLNGKGQWFKKYKLDYQTEIIKLFCYPLVENQ